MHTQFRLRLPLAWPLIILVLIFTVSAELALAQSAPLQPKVLVAAEHGRVHIFWDEVAESSIDSLTGYADFEGYRIYRSLDGGITWGTEEDSIFSWGDDKEFLGWRPIAQFDLTFEEDSTRCLFKIEDCGANDTLRGIDVSGFDPNQPEIFLGNNSGIQYTYIDEGVTDGIEYTYAVTAYDMGLQTFAVEYVEDNGVFIADTVWSPANPLHFTGPDGNGVPSLECSKGTSTADSNFVTIVPGFYASNISFPDDINEFIVRQEETIGTGDIVYDLVDTDQLSSRKYVFEIQAEQSAVAIDGMKCENPWLYIYEVNDSTEQRPVDIETTISAAGLDSLQIDSLLDGPGVFLEDGVISIPEYKMITRVNERSEVLDGIQFEYTNLSLGILPVPVFIEIDTVEWSEESLVQFFTEIGLSTNQGNYNKRLNFDYKIEFFSEPIGDTAIHLLNPTWVTPLPFRITNLYTGKKVGLKHKDTGSDGLFKLDLGAIDRNYTINEELQFSFDTLSVNGVEGPQQTYFVTFNYNPQFLADQYSTVHGGGLEMRQFWDPLESYTKNAMVGHKSMPWYSLVDNNVGVEPSIEFIDTNGDGVNDNPWRVLYPWSDFRTEDEKEAGGPHQDSSFVIVKPKKFFVDGDRWLADMSLLGESHAVTESELDSIKVVPNPYLVRSGYYETASDRRIRFVQLPQQCRISIFTVTGELVKSFEHNDVYSGNIWWDLRTGSGNLIAPGLYIYIVEAGDKQHVGKFAVVR